MKSKRRVLKKTLRLFIRSWQSSQARLADYRTADAAIAQGSSLTLSLPGGETGLNVARKLMNA